MKTKNEIDKLAEIMQREFGAAQKRDEAMDDKIDKLESKMDDKIDKLESKMGEKFDRVDERFDEVLGRDDKIFKRLDNLETDNTMSAGASRRQEDKLENHEERIVAVEEKLGIGETV